MFLIDGSPRSALESSDRGLLYGDGLFETIAVIDGQIPLWDRHIGRLLSGCAKLGIPSPDPEQLRSEVRQVSADESRCVVKIIVTRGSGGEAYRPPKTPRPTRLVQHRPWPNHPAAHWEQGIALRLCKTRLAVGSPVAGLKHLNRLEQVLARAEWTSSDIAEGLMLDHQGHLVEGTMTNLFIQEGRRWITPPVDLCGVAGVLRGLVFDLAPQLGMVVEEQRSTSQRAMTADALFVTNSVIGLWPVRRFEAVNFDVPEEVRNLARAAESIIGSRP